MSIGNRKLLTVSVIVAVLALANAAAIVVWLQGIGLIPLAEYLCAEYITGTAITIIVVLLVLLPTRTVWAMLVRRCRVCDATVLRQGRYCADCGSRT